MNNKHLQIILKKQCEIVGADFDKMDFKKPNWFWDYEWTSKEEEGFIVWLEQYLIDDKKARDEIMRYPNKNKRDIKKVVQEFIMQYGWKTNK